MNQPSFLAKLTAFFLSAWLIFLNGNLALAVEASSTSSTVEDAVEIPSATSTEPVASTTPERVLILEPTIRVGLYKTKKAVTVASPFAYTVFNGTEEVGVLPESELVSLSYNRGLYTVSSTAVSFTSPHFIRLVPSDPANYFTVTSYSRIVKGRGQESFNAYRGTLEYRYSPKSKLPYIINELPLDEYVAGIAEFADATPEEYAKALLTATRSYAFTHISSAPATEKRLFDVYATTADQIYLGYNSELMMPRAAAAASSTAGLMVTYKGQPIITPYFGHAAGKTKSWPGKSRPWLTSVKTPYDKFKKYWGHGYGMSCHDAELHAKKEGWTYEEILTYYYSGTEVERVY